MYLRLGKTSPAWRSFSYRILRVTAVRAATQSMFFGSPVISGKFINSIYSDILKYFLKAKMLVRPCASGRRLDIFFLQPSVSNDIVVTLYVFLCEKEKVLFKKAIIALNLHCLFSQF